MVALESTIISHGLPRPENLVAARRFEQLLVDADVVPSDLHHGVYNFTGLSPNTEYYGKFFLFLGAQMDHRTIRHGDRAFGETQARGQFLELGHDQRPL